MLRTEFKTEYNFSKTVLGPIFYEYCYRLHHYFMAMRQQNAVALYMARGGLRLHYLYNRYCKINNFSPPLPEQLFFISRFAAARGCLLADFNYVAPYLVREFKGLPVSALVRSLLNGDGTFEQQLRPLQTNLHELSALLKKDDYLAKQLRNSLKKQAKLLHEYVYKLTEGKNQVVLIDTGWSAKTQSMLMRAFPELNWLGLYWGRWDYDKNYPSYFVDVIGVCLEGVVYDPRQPASSIFCYHHLLEGILEVPINSTKGYDSNISTGEVVPDSHCSYHDLMSAIMPGQDELMFQGIVDFYNESEQQQSGVEITKQARAAYKVLQRMILYPRRRDIKIMHVNSRSVDYGKSETLPVIIKSTDTEKRKILASFNRIRNSLWKQGQIVEDWGVLSPLFLFFYHALLLYRFACEGIKKKRQKIISMGRIWLQIRL